MGREFTYANLNYLNVDSRGNGNHTGYEPMANAIKDLAETSGKPPIFLSLCQWGRVCCTSYVQAGVLVFTCSISNKAGCGQGSMVKVGG